MGSGDKYKLSYLILFLIWHGYRLEGVRPYKETLHPQMQMLDRDLLIPHPRGEEKVRVAIQR